MFVQPVQCRVENFNKIVGEKSLIKFSNTKKDLSHFNLNCKGNPIEEYRLLKIARDEAMNSTRLASSGPATLFWSIPAHFRCAHICPRRKYIDPSRWRSFLGNPLSL